MSSASGPVMLSPVRGLASIAPGDDLAALLIAALAADGDRLAAGDVVAVAQKVVSKAEGRIVRLADVVPSSEAAALAATTRKDARLVELVLRESSAVVRAAPDVLIVRHRCGFVMANAGIDQSNAGAPDGACAVLLPADPAASARALRARFEAAYGAGIGVVITDSFGRPWRLGTVGVALAVAGVPALDDLRGRTDRDGRVLRTTEVGFADEIAAAAGLVMGQADEGVPAVIVRGLVWQAGDQDGRELLRPLGADLFR